MDKSIITFSANEQNLQKTGGIGCYASDTVSYVEAQFTLGENWSGYDSVRAVWFNDYKTISTVLDSDGVCIVPHEVLVNRGKVMVNLVGSILVSDELSDRLTTFPCEALKVSARAKISGSETAQVTPSQFEQFVAIVQDAVANIKDIVSTTLNADYTLTFVYSDGTSYTTPSIRGERGPRGADGADGTDGNGIASAVLNSNYTLTLTFTDGTSYTTPSIRGAQGPKGDPGDVSQAQLDAAVADLKSDIDDITTIVIPENIFDKDTMVVNDKWYYSANPVGNVISLSDASFFSGLKIPVGDLGESVTSVTLKQNKNVGDVVLKGWYAVDAGMKGLSTYEWFSTTPSIKNGYTISDIDPSAAYLLITLTYYEQAEETDGYHLSVAVGSEAKDYTPYFEPYRKITTLPDNIVTTNKIVDESVTPQKTSFMELKHGENQFDIDAMLYENKWYTGFTVGSKAVMSDLAQQYHDTYIAFRIPLYKAEPFVMSVASNSNAQMWKYALVDENDIVLSKNDTQTYLKDGVFVSSVDASTVSVVGTLMYWKTELVDKNISMMVAYGTTIKDFVPYVAPWWDAPNKTADEAYEIAITKRTAMYITADDDDTDLLLKMLEAFNTGNVDVYFEKATYTLYDAYDYIRNTLGWSWAVGLPIGNGCHYYFNDSTIISNAPSDNYSDSRNVLDCQVRGTDYEVHDVTLINNGGRYCIHDEGNNSRTPYCHKYENVVMIYNKTALTPDTGAKAFGCGTGFDASLMFDGCVFIQNNGQTSARLAIHGPTTNPNHDTSKLHLIMKNCYIDEGNIYVQDDTFEDGSELDFFLFGNKTGTAFSDSIVNLIENNNTIIS